MILVVAGICIRDGAVLLTQRPPGKHLAGMWEFPGGKIDHGESPQQALAREFKEEIDVDVVSAEPYTFVHHHYAQKEVLLLFFTCEVEGEPKALENNPVRWVPFSEFDQLEFPEADMALVERLKVEFG